MKLPELAKKMALAAGATALTLLLAEVGVRLWGFDPDVAEAMRFHHTLGWTLDAAGVHADQVQPDGFRMRPVPLEKPPGERRLVILGDSFAAGMSFPYDLTFAGRLEQWLSRDGETWRVINLSVGDWGNVQQLRALQEYGLAYSPDAVLVQLFPFNDLCNDAQELMDTCSLRDYLRPYLVSSPSGPEFVFGHPLGGRLRSVSRLFSVAESGAVWFPRRWRGLEPGNRAAQAEFFRENARRLGLPYGGGGLASLQPPESQPPAVAAAWERLRAAVREIADTLRPHGIPLVALVIPYSHTLEPFWTDYSKRYPGVAAENATATAEQYLADLRIPTVSVRRRIAEGGLGPADCFLMPRDSHLNAFGHAAVALWVMQELNRANLAQPPADLLRQPVLDAMDAAAAPPALYNTSGLYDYGRGPFITGYGPESRIVFFSAEAGQGRLDFELLSELPLRVRFRHDPGLEGEEWTAERKHQRLEGSFSFPVSAGRNEVLVSYSDWAGRDEEGPRGRPLAVRFQKLRLQLSP